MKTQTKHPGRDTRLAVLLAFLLPGLGQVYNGELVKGASLFILILVSMAAGVRLILPLPDNLLIYGALAVMLAGAALYIFGIVDAFNRASRSEASFMPRAYNRWYFYLAAWLLGHAVFGLGQGYVRDHFLEAYAIPTSSMEPSVHAGDYVLADKTAYDRMAPQKGDIVIFVNPDNRSQRYIKRIEALPGDPVPTSDGGVLEVPHGSVFVTGDNLQRSRDSRHFGFVPLRDIVGKARQVYFSRGPRGIVWDRIGLTVGGKSE
ncbi:MAG: signal peptidase I [Acidobacteria bacterium]|nr:signal peptidase I [Acidobacteriota bacterium]